MRIYVVDDDPSLRGFIKRWLAAYRTLEVRTFEDGAAAVEAMEQAPPTLLLSDLDMPGLCGEDVARAAARLPRPPRVVLMSGDLWRLERARPLAEATLEKPFSVTELMSILEAPSGRQGCGPHS
ncbi:MAG TPA: response regulator [Vicinamibacteria bacterium]|jgi:CheY-like chemotaxis protein|nr:response regulator [Vicinamibacteria bacterium]